MHAVHLPQHHHLSLNTAAWAVSLGLSCALVIYAVAVLPAARQKAIDDIAREHEALCEKFGLGRATQEHVACTVDLMHLRERAIQAASESII